MLTVDPPISSINKQLRGCDKPKMSLKTTAEEYFGSLNSIATRLCCDLQETKSSYEDLWETLPEKERQDILTESIMKPEITVKYCPSKGNLESEYAVKLIFDDNCSYRDEHSGPFSFRTRSQRDLSIVQTETPTKVAKSKSKGVKPKIKQLPLMYQDPILEPESKRELPMDSNNTLPKTGLDFLDNW